MLLILALNVLLEHHIHVLATVPLKQARCISLNVLELEDFVARMQSGHKFESRSIKKPTIRLMIRWPDVLDLPARLVTIAKGQTHSTSCWASCRSDRAQARVTITLYQTESENRMCG